MSTTWAVPALSPGSCPRCRVWKEQKEPNMFQTARQPLYEPSISASNMSPTRRDQSICPCYRLWATGWVLRRKDTEDSGAHSDVPCLGGCCCSFLAQAVPLHADTARSSLVRGHSRLCLPNDTDFVHTFSSSTSSSMKPSLTLAPYRRTSACASKGQGRLSCHIGTLGL